MNNNKNLRVTYILIIKLSFVWHKVPIVEYSGWLKLTLT